MKRREKLLEEREQLETEYNKCHKIWMDAFNKKRDLLPKFHVDPYGVRIATLIATEKFLSEYDNADKDEREASAKLRETLEKIWEINTKLQV